MKKIASKLKVLLVEDSKTTIETVCGFMEKMDIRNPFIAESGKAAIELFKKNRPDIVEL